MVEQDDKDEQDSAPEVRYAQETIEPRAMT